MCTLGSLFFSNLATSAPQKPSHTVEIFSINKMNGDSGNTELFAIIGGQGGYSIKDKTKNKIIAKDLYYLKTFGGMPATLCIHLVDKRYLIVPCTVEGSVKKDDQFYAHMATTRTYDLKTSKMVAESKPYRYDHDVPLKYDINSIPMWEFFYSHKMKKLKKWQLSIEPHKSRLNIFLKQKAHNERK